MSSPLPPIAELRTRYVDEGKPLPRRVEKALRNDPRAGAQRILEAVLDRRANNRAEGQRLRRMLRYERSLWSDGATLVAGVDEAGMSPIAGPVVAAAVVLPVGWKYRGIDDSKVLAAEVREELAGVIKAEAIAWAVGRATCTEIDEINIYHAGLLAMRRAVEALQPVPDALLVDARQIPDTLLPQTGIIRGDSKSLSIAAASIIAKTTRDAHMVAMDGAYPAYGFARHKGYPVPQHWEALKRHGALPIHRMSFPSVRKVLGLGQQELFA